MEFEKIQNNALMIEEILDTEGIMPIDELQDLTNMEEKDVLIALDWLKEKERIQLFRSGKALSVMLVF